jgi:hypothetical protein
MKKIQDLFPQFVHLIKAFHRALPAMYEFRGIKICTLLENALKNDPDEIDEDFIPLIASAVGGWLEYPIVIDYFETDEARMEFEQTTLHLEENTVFREFLEKNKLRLNPIKRINTMFEMVPSLIVNDELRAKWNELYHVAISDYGQKSIYHEYDIEQRMSYVIRVEKLVRVICIEYIKLEGVIE